MSPLWAQLAVDGLIIFGLPWIIGFVVHRAHIRGQALPDRRIDATEKLALQAAKSIAPMNGIDTRREAADVVLLLLCKEYGVAVPDKKAREHCLNAAFFDIGG